MLASRVLFFLAIHSLTGSRAILSMASKTLNAYGSMLEGHPFDGINNATARSLPAPTRGRIVVDIRQDLRLDLTGTSTGSIFARIILTLYSADRNR